MNDPSDWGPWRGGVVDTSAQTHAWAVYDNKLFVVIVVKLWSAWGQLDHLAIRRTDGQSVVWDDKQRIKNELCGADAVAIEVYPKQSAVVNQAPVGHLWVLPRGFELPFWLRSIGGPV